MRMRWGGGCWIADCGFRILGLVKCENFLGGPGAAPPEALCPGLGGIRSFGGPALRLGDLGLGIGESVNESITRGRIRGQVE